MLRITVKLNEVEVRKLEVNGDALTIGRSSENDLRIDNLAVSGKHARIVRDGASYFLEDMDSTNGTYVGNQRITYRELKDGDRVTIGKHTLLLEIPDRDQAKRPPDLNKTMILDTREHWARIAPEEAGDSLLQKGPMGRVTVLSGAAGDAVHELPGRMTVFGKDPTAKICLKGMFVPEIAGFFYRGPAGYELMPPEKRNKLKLNGQPVDRGMPLKEGDLIEVGGVRMTFGFKN